MLGWDEGRDSDRVLSTSASRRKREKRKERATSWDTFTELTLKFPLKCHNSRATSFHSVFLRALEIPSNDSDRVKWPNVWHTYYFIHTCTMYHWKLLFINNNFIPVYFCILQVILFNSPQFSSVVQSCPTLCNPMNHSTPGLPVHHQLPEFTQTHVHWVGDDIQPSHPLSSPSPPAPNPSQHQGLFQWVNSLHEVAKVLEFQLQHLPMNIQDWSPFGWTGWISLQSKGLSRVFSTPQFKSINSSALSFLHSPTLTIHTWPLENSFN